MTSCVDTFRRKALEKDEESCVNNCVDKFNKVQQRAMMRFVEHQHASQLEAIAKAQAEAGNA